MRVSVIEGLVANNQDFADGFDGAGLSAPPTKEIAVVACMDARLDVYRILGLETGEAHVIRNAGGIVTDDVIRSLVISQHALGTRSIALVQHTECGMIGLNEDDLAERLENETGAKPAFGFGAFDDLEVSLKRAIEDLRANPFVPHTDDVRGFVYDVGTGLLREVAP